MILRSGMRTQVAGAVLRCVFLTLAPCAFAAASYHNPVIAGDHPDPSIIRVGNDFWATATSSEWGPQFPLLHSTDLVNWDNVGSVFPHRPDWAVGNFWAPEIAEYKGRFFIYYVGRKKNGPLAVAVATADNPAGPYTDHGPLVAQEDGSIDPVPATDEHGRRFLIWKEDGNSRHQSTPLWAQPLDDDGTKLVGEPKELLRNDAKWEGALVEGPFLLQHGSWFYLFYSGNGCCGPGCDYALGVARSRALLGPWEKNPANPILAGNQYWKCPGHGSIVTDQQGRCWLLYHAYSVTSTVFTGREAMLDEVQFGTDDWPVINHGQGPSASAASPLGASQRKAELSFFDDFKTPFLQPGWQWPQDDEPSVQLRAWLFRHGPRDAPLLLAPKPGHAKDGPGAVLARSTTTGDYVAIVEVQLASLKPGTAAGLSAFGDSANALGLAVGDGKLILWRRDKGTQTQLAQADAPKTSNLQLRMTATGGYHFQFAASADGRNWIGVGDDLVGRQLPPWDRSIRVALVVSGGDFPQAGFNSFRLQAASAR
jgi:beta-xylosidase